MEKLVFLILSREGDNFNIVYAGDCERTDKKSFFVQHPDFKCWVRQSRSERSLYLAILPMFDSTDNHRHDILDKIKTHYKPPCNLADTPKVEPDYAVRKTTEPSLEPKRFPCPCCGSEMRPEKTLKRSTLYRCTSCNISDTRIND